MAAVVAPSCSLFSTTQPRLPFRQHQQGPLSSSSRFDLHSCCRVQYASQRRPSSSSNPLRVQAKAERSPYDVLGVDQKADSSTIKRAYRKLVKSRHPDVLGNSEPETVKMFLELQNAYEILSSPESRRNWDSGAMQKWAERAAMTRAAAQKDIAQERARKAQQERERQAAIEANLIKSITWLMIAWPLSYIMAIAVQILMPGSDVHRARHVGHFGSVTATRATHTTYTSTANRIEAATPTVASAFTVSYN